MSFYPLDAVMDACRGRWVDVLGRLGVRVELLQPRHGPCPGCGGRDRFRFDDKDGEGTFICSQGGGGLLSGNGLTLLQHCTGWSFKESLEQLGRMLLPDSAKVQLNFADRGPMPTAPRAEPVGIPQYDERRLRDYVSGMPRITRDGLRRLSPVPFHSESPVEDVLEVLYGDKERVLVFTSFFSQGDYLYQVGSGSCRLSPERGVRAVVAPLPRSAPEGVWMLCNPVDGKWQPEPETVKWERVRDGMHGPPRRVIEPGKWKRRTWRNVTRYRYCVLESDSAPEDLWLKCLVRLPVPIVAIYSSGGRSLHALVRVDAESKAEWDLIVRGIGATGRGLGLMGLCCVLGADPAALSAVRLTRLPFAFREGGQKDGRYARYAQPRQQEMVYLDRMPLSERPQWGVSIEQRVKGVLS